MDKVTGQEVLEGMQNPPRCKFGRGQPEKGETIATHIHLQMNEMLESDFWKDTSHEKEAEAMAALANTCFQPNHDFTLPIEIEDMPVKVFRIIDYDVNDEQAEQMVAPVHMGQGG